ncbi:MAG: flavodoxin family protein [Anaerovoracaceae bacterium]|jgi:multimeric flavodoxin WrbA
MRILVINGSPRRYGNTTAHCEAFQKGAEQAGHTVNVIQAGIMDISPCRACEYCHTKEKGVCIQKDDMQILLQLIDRADMIVFASPVHYFGFSGQMESVISRFYAKMKPKATKYALFLSSMNSGVYESIERQYQNLVRFFHGEDLGMFEYHDEENGSEKTLQELEAFGASIK